MRLLKILISSVIVALSFLGLNEGSWSGSRRRFVSGVTPIPQTNYVWMGSAWSNTKSLLEFDTTNSPATDTSFEGTNTGILGTGGALPTYTAPTGGLYGEYSFDAGDSLTITNIGGVANGISFMAQVGSSGLIDSYAVSNGVQWKNGATSSWANVFYTTNDNGIIFGNGNAMRLHKPIIWTDASRMNIYDLNWYIRSGVSNESDIISGRGGGGMNEFLFDNRAGIYLTLSRYHSCDPVAFGGVVQDQSPNALAGASPDAPTIVQEINNTWYDFDGVSEVISTPDNANVDFTTNFSIVFWVKIGNTNQSNAYIVDKANAYAVLYGFVSKTVEFFSSGHSGADTRAGTQIVVDDTDWHQIAYTYDGVTQKGYLDGVEQFSTNKVFSLANNATAVFFGDTSGGAAPFDGGIDEIMLDNVALASNIVYQHYNTLTNRFF